MKLSSLISIVLLQVAACGSGGSNETAKLATFDDTMEMDMPVTAQPAPPAEPTEEPTIAKKLIKTGGIDFQSENVEEDYKKINSLLPKFGAYIENENQNKSTQRINYNMTIRVPWDKYDTLFSTISGLAYRLENKHSNVQDVTERYYDLKTRIKNKKALEQRYLELLNKAHSIKDILEIERNLNQVRTEIESLQGQFNYLSKQINFSTLHVSFYEELPYTYDSTQRKGFGARILSALNNGWQGFLSLLVAITTLWPFILLAGAVLYSIRWVRKNRKKD